MKGLVEKESEIKEKWECVLWHFLLSLNYHQQDLHATALFEVVCVSNLYEI